MVEIELEAKKVLFTFLDSLKTIHDKSQLANYLTENKIISKNFELRYLNNISDNERAFSNTKYTSITENQVVASLEALDTVIYQAILIKKSHWEIDSFKFTCMSCFGTDPKCNVCGGDGWGVL